MSSKYREVQKFVADFLVLLVRSVLLWVIVPTAAFVWMFIGWRISKMGVGFRQYLGWVDHNLVAFLQRSVFRPIVRDKNNFVGVGSMSTISSRVSVTDPF